MSSEQVAAVLRQSSMQGQMVKFIVARPIHNPVGDVELVNTSSGGLERIEFDANNKPIITNLSSPNSQSVVVKTSEILTDKKLNLMQLIEAEQQTKSDQDKQQQKPPEQPQPEQTVSEIKPEQLATRKEEPSPPPPPVSETKPPTEIRIDKIDDNHVLVRLPLTSDDLDRSSFLDTLNSSLKRLAVTLDRFVDEQTTTSDVYFLVKEIVSGGEQPLGASESVKLEAYDFLVEVNGQPVGYQNNVSQISLATADKHLSLKFRNDPSFKLQVR